MNSTPNHDKWRADVKAVLDKYIGTDGTAPECVDLLMRMYSAMRVTQYAIRGDNDAFVRNGVAQMLVDITYGIPQSNWVRNTPGSAGVLLAFTNATNAFFDGLSYVDTAMNVTDAAPGVGANNINAADREVHNDSFIKGIACSYAIHDIAIMALLAQRGPGAYRNLSRALRDELVSVKDG